MGSALINAKKGEDQKEEKDEKEHPFMHFMSTAYRQKRFSGMCQHTVASPLKSGFITC